MTFRGRAPASALVGVLVVCLALVQDDAPGYGGPDAYSAARQELSMRYTNGALGVSTGTEVTIRFRNPSDPDGKPIPVRRETFVFPRGTRLDPAVVPACNAIPAALMLLGESACPPETRVGGGTATAVSGSPFDPVHIEIDGFENGSGLTLLSTVRGLGIRFVAHAVRNGRTLTVDYPRSPGGPPDGETALREVNNVFVARSAATRAYVRTPSRCPRSGHWTFIGRFTYADGVTQTARASQRCRGN